MAGHGAGPGKHLILGTAGHIDHGKTALVEALTGVDTDRLAEEKRRGITIELGFAQYMRGKESAFGVVDVPGHEGFVRTMVAGATGMDVVLLVVAADEGVMPQTREHLSIIQLLGIEALVVAITKVDMVDPEWLELVHEDVGDVLADTPFGDAPVIATSARTGEGMGALARALGRSARRAQGRASDDLARLPADRVFAKEGAGTVVTGTLWSGRLERGATVRIMPGGEEARIRAVEVHGGAVDAAVAGQRTAVALTGASVRRGLVGRGDVLVSGPGWRASMMLTVRLDMLRGVESPIATDQRIRVHLATVEVMARVVLLDIDELSGGQSGLAQLRLEAPVVARAGDRFVARFYSPVWTIAGGVVLEPAGRKRTRLTAREQGALELLARGGADAVMGAAALAGWRGLEVSATGVLAGWRGPLTEDATGALFQADGRLFTPRVVEEGKARLLEAVRRHHLAHSLEPGVPLASLRAALPREAHTGLADGIAGHLVQLGELVIEGKVGRLPDFQIVLSDVEAALAHRIEEALADAELQGPETDELIGRVGGSGRIRPVLDFLVSEGRVQLLGDAYWVSAVALDRAAAQLVEMLGGRRGLGPADFRHVLPVTRKHLIPILAHMDMLGVTLRLEDGRSVAEELP